MTPTTNAHIFLVDDDPVARMILSDILTNAGYNITAADSGTQAETLIKDHYQSGQVFNACFFDVSLGDTTGVALLNNIHAQLPTFQPPIIFLSANAKIEVDTLHGEAEGTYFLEKPFTSSTILEILTRLNVMP